ncbi:DNA cytosine methyltransferase [Devosia aquimaris]|uniref:DNA cytosine methyltransferase n=1 Tax=Devosia aquimaris TaxID=2866214 RepID=UPI001CD0D801|nr:DNA (cytosine-5-)-methyltransferase [Devosia sp. CJK-A8-3]
MRAVDLFCGAGGMSLGFQRAGFDLVQAYDSWEPAVASYRRNIGSHVWLYDLRDVFTVGPMLAALRPDIIVGGPPCQDYSAAGRRIEGENAGMTRAFAMYLCIVRPSWFVMENVRQAQKSHAWADARQMIKAAGYGLTETVLDASWYGTPQSRKRLVIIGRLGERDGFLAAALAAARSKRQTVVGDVLDVPQGHFYMRPFGGGRGVRSAAEPAPAIIRTSRERPWSKYLNSPHPDDPIPAEEAAILTRDQVARIQGFPEGWEWGSATSRDIDQLIANALPSQLAEVVGRVILAREAGTTIPVVEGSFLQWLQRRGRSPQSARNVKSQCNRARRLLGGKTHTRIALEIEALEAIGDFQRLEVRTQSHLRTALRLHADFLLENAQRRGAPPMAITCRVA